jgi:hypothetical protein
MHVELGNVTDSLHAINTADLNTYGVLTDYSFLKDVPKI